MARRNLAAMMGGSSSSEEEMEALEVEPISAVAPPKAAEKGKAKVVGVAKKKVAPAPAGGERLMGGAIRAAAAEAARKQGAPGSKGVAAGEEGLSVGLSGAAANRAKQLGAAELKEKMVTSLQGLMEVGMGLVGLSEREKALKEKEKILVHLEREVEASKRIQRRMQADLAQERARRGEAEARVSVLEGQVRSLGDETRELREVRNFWVEEGAELIVRKCLDSEAYFSWFVEFGKQVRKVGYCAGVERVFAQCKDRLGNYRIVEMKGYKILDAAADDLINNAYERLQSGEVRFPILEALSSNPGLTAEQLRNFEEPAGPGLGGAGTAKGVSTSTGEKRSASFPPSGSEATKKARTTSGDAEGSAGSSTPADEEIVVDNVEEEEAAGDDLTRTEKEELVDRAEEAVGLGGAPEGGGDEPPEGSGGGAGAEMP